MKERFIAGVSFKFVPCAGKQTALCWQEEMGHERTGKDKLTAEACFCFLLIFLASYSFLMGCSA